MKKNVGTADRAIRTIVVVVVGFFVLHETLSGSATRIFGIVAVMLLLTSVVSFCPIYAPFKISAAKK
jgi:amino acid permease